ncbi:MAG: S8 family serine peptidase [Pseudomonadota bacterium]
MHSFAHIILAAFAIVLLSQDAQAQYRLDRSDCYALGATATVTGPGFGRSPSGRILLTGSGPAVVARATRWSIRRISVVIPRRGLSEGAMYSMLWERPGTSALTLGRLEICSDAASNRPERKSRTTKSKRAGSDVVSAPDGSSEYALTVSTGQANAAANAMQSVGAQLLRTRNIPGLGQQMQFYAFPGNLTLQQARAALQNVASTAVIDLHHIYRLSSGPRLYHSKMLGDDPSKVCRLRGAVRVGVIDGPVNTDHAALKGVSVTRKSVLSAGERHVGADHGTAVAALIAGGPAAGPLIGVAPGAQVFAAAAFSNAKGRNGGRLENVAAGIGWLAGQRVRLVNMSFAGPPNATMGRILTLSASKGMVMIAAAGNDRSSKPKYPAAAPEVIAITAVDAAGRLFRKANTGKHIEFAAPGVDIYSAKGAGASYQSGTSFAAPLVIGLLARRAARGAFSINNARKALRQNVRDIGASGRDTKFGYGLVQSNGC